MSTAEIIDKSTGKILPEFLPPFGTVTSPLEVKSSNGEYQITLQQDDSGNAYIYSYTTDDTEKPGDLQIRNINQGNIILETGNSSLRLSSDGVGGTIIDTQPDGGNLEFNVRPDFQNGIYISNTTSGTEISQVDEKLEIQLGGNTITMEPDGTINAEGVTFGTSNCEVTYGTNNIQLVSTAGEFSVTDKTSVGTIYDTHFNPPPKASYEQGTSQTGTTLATTVYNFTPTTTGLYVFQFFCELGDSPNINSLEIYANVEGSATIINFSSLYYPTPATPTSFDNAIMLSTGFLRLTAGTTYQFHIAPGTTWNIGNTGEYGYQIISF